MLSRTLPTQVADHVRERIVSGALAPGDRVIETELADELGVSRHTLRTALQTLTFEGLLTQSQFKSTHVARPTARDVYETYTLRNTLEAMACRLAAERAATAEPVGIDDAMARMRDAAAADDVAALRDADFGFHVAVVEFTQHRRLIEHVRMLHVQTRLYLNLTSALDYEPRRIVDLHAEIADAIRAGNAARAESLGAAHNVEDGEALCALLAEQQADRPHG